MNYRDKAICCVKDTVLPMQRAQFEECGRCLDKQYKRYGNTPWLQAKTIDEGRVYEIGYPPVCMSGRGKRKSKRRIALRMFTPERIVYYRRVIARQENRRGDHRNRFGRCRQMPLQGNS